MRRARQGRVLLLVLLSAAGAACASARGGASPADGHVGALDSVTLITRDDDTSLRLYRDALGLRARGPFRPDSRTRKAQRRLLGIPAGIEWQLYIFDQPAVPNSLRIRLLVIDQETPRIRAAWSARGLGPAGLGFAARNLRALDLEMRRVGFSSLNELESHRLSRPGAASCELRETTFNAPDFAQAALVGLDERARDSATAGAGGGVPIFSAQIVEHSDEVLAFYTGVLGLTLHDDLEWQGGRLFLVGAAGEVSPRALFIDYREAPGSAQTRVAPRPPNRGLALWSFPVRDLHEMERRAKAARVPILHGPLVYASPDLGRERAMTVLAPNGFLIELHEPLGPRG